MSDKTEWPTSDRIAELRTQGIVSYSNRSSACLVIAVLAIAGLAAPSLTTLFGDLLAFGAEAQSAVSIVEKFRATALTWIVAPAAGVAAVIIVWGLLQTRFLFHLGLISLDFSRLFPKTSLELPSVVERLAFLIASVLVSFVGAFFLLKILGIQIFRILHSAGDRAVLEALSTPVQLLPVVILIGIVGAVVFLLYEKLRFGMNNRMTRKEVLAERNG